MNTIKKKTWPEYFQKILDGKKTFDLRIADFEVREGDTLVLEEWDPDKKEYTGRKIEAIASYILKTKGHTFWPQEGVDKYGFQVIQIEPKIDGAEPVFKPRDGQVDYTNIRYVPVINCVVRHGGRILIVERNKNMRLYPGLWNGISGFLDDASSIEEKVREELREELGIGEHDILSIHRGPVFDHDEPKYGKTWIIHTILVDVKTDQIKLDWEAQNYKWIKAEDAKNFNLLPGFDKIISSLIIT